MERKIDVLQRLVLEKNFKKALSIASRFVTGKYANEIKSGDMAYKYPSFCQQINKNPDELINNGIQALIAKYSLKYSQ